jgi:hypothetical protein
MRSGAAVVVMLGTVVAFASLLPSAAWLWVRAALMVLMSTR